MKIRIQKMEKKMRKSSLFLFVVLSFVFGGFLKISAQKAKSEDNFKVQIHEIQLKDGSFRWDCYIGSRPILKLFGNKDAPPNRVWLCKNSGKLYLELFLKENGIKSLGYYDENQEPFRNEYDRNNDGLIDDIIFTRNKKTIRQDSDLDADGIADFLQLYDSNGNPIRRETLSKTLLPNHITTFKEAKICMDQTFHDSGLPYISQFYKEGILRVSYMDENGDGMVDKIEIYNEKGEIESSLLDENGDGIPDFILGIKDNSDGNDKKEKQ